MPKLIRNLAAAGMAAAAVFVFCCVILHLIQPELSPVDDAVSYYMNGRLGWILSVGLIALGFGSLSIGYALRLAFAATASSAGLWLLAIWGVGVVLGGIFPPDPRGHWDQPPSLSGMIHGGAAMVAFMVFPVAAFLLSRTTRLRIVALLSAVSLFAFFACLAPVFTNHAPYILGLVERVLLALYVAWLLAAGLFVSRGR